MSSLSARRAEMMDRRRTTESIAELDGRMLSLVGKLQQLAERKRAQAAVEKCIQIREETGDLEPLIFEPPDLEPEPAG